MRSNVDWYCRKNWCWCARYHVAIYPSLNCGLGKSSLIQALLQYEAYHIEKQPDLRCFSMTKLNGGKIEIDRVNICDIGLDVLRGKLALGLYQLIFPFPSTCKRLNFLFLKKCLKYLHFSLVPCVRTCEPHMLSMVSLLAIDSFGRDPLGTRTDAELISALQRAWLLPRDGTKDPAAEAKFSLDATVSDEGRNL